MIKSVIISGPPAIGKTTIAKGIGKEFGLRHLSGGDILKELAQDEGFDTGGDDWWDTSEGMSFLSHRQENSEFDKKVDAKLKKLFLRYSCLQFLTIFDLKSNMDMESNFRITLHNIKINLCLK